jgi:SAM-dependent methyltransferase
MLDRIGRALAREMRRINPSGKLDPERLIDAGLRFRAALDKVKAEMPHISWYPYDSFMNLYPLRALLEGERRHLLDLAAGAPVLDLGCGDGALSFFLESLGAAVHAVDNASTNFNGMRGVRVLKESLGSAVEIFEVDVDARFALPADRYGLALFFGTLYHLKNPFYALETLARHARWCLLSTRVARLTPGGVNFHDLPMAYLLDDRESNADPTNYWIFSEAGLRRILHRSGWDVPALTTTGDTHASDPAGAATDERAFCLLRSRMLP